MDNPPVNRVDSFVVQRLQADGAAVLRFIAAVSRCETWQHRFAHHKDDAARRGMPRAACVQRAGLLLCFVCKRLRTACELMHLCRVR